MAAIFKCGTRWAMDSHAPPQDETGIGAQILADLKLSTIRLLTNHPRRVIGVDAFGIEIVGQVPIPGWPVGGLFA